MFFHSFKPASVYLLAALLFPGCSSDTGDRVAVSGSVTIDGSPLDEGIITFVAVDGGPTAATSIEMGEYSLAADAGPSPGENRVQIIAYKEDDSASSTPVGSGLTDPSESSPKAKGVGGADEPNQLQYIPDRYNTKTELTADLHMSANTSVDFELESNP